MVNEDTPTPSSSAFAVYSDDDKSLNFYKRENVPSKGSLFEGKTATYVWTGIEDGPISMFAPEPSPGGSPFEKANSSKSVAVIDEGISAPFSIVEWFHGFTECVSMDLSKLDTSRTDDMRSMFSGCTSLASLDLSGWDTQKALWMDNMFFHCSSLKSLDISGWDTSAVKNMDNMFYGCDSLEKITVGDRFHWGSDQPLLPANGPDGKWYAASDGKGYAPSDIPLNKADTYYSSKKMIQRDMSRVKFYSDTKAKIDSKSIENGALYVAKDVGELYVDFDSKRIAIGKKPPLATVENPGIVKPDGSTILIDEQGTISVSGDSKQKIWHDTRTPGEFYKSTENPTSTEVGKYDGYLYATRVYNAVWNDYAELFEAKEKVETGFIAYASPEGVTKTGLPQCAVGVVSDRWGHLLGGDGKHDSENYVPISLAGRIPIKVNEKIKIGDMIAATSDGTGKKATSEDFGCILGKCVGPDPDGREDFVYMLVGVM